MTRRIELSAVPYTPGFGVVPELLAGRSEQLDLHERALLAGPRDQLFTQAVIGERGVGKTVFLEVLAERMRDAHGWVVLRYQARKRVEALPEILGELPQAAGRALKGRRWGSVEQQIGVQINTGIVKLSGSSTIAGRQRSPSMALAHALRAIGEAAARRGRGVLLSIDEAQTLSERDLGELGMIAQTVAHADRLPVAITLAGTPELSALLLRSGSFLERMPRSELHMLTGEQTRLALLAPANRRGVTWDERALDLVGERVGGYPYFVQLAGYHAWQHANPAVQGRITLADAAAGVEAVSTDADRMFRERWQRLGPAQHRYLAVLARLQAEDPRHRPVATSKLAASLGRSTTSLSRVRASLINEHHLLRSGARGEVEFAIPRFGAWVAQQKPHTRSRARGGAAAGTKRVRAAQTDRNGAEADGVTRAPVGDDVGARNRAR